MSFGVSPSTPLLISTARLMFLKFRLSLPLQSQWLTTQCHLLQHIWTPLEAPAWHWPESLTLSSFHHCSLPNRLLFHPSLWWSPPFFFFWPHSVACGISVVPPTRDWIQAMAVKAWNPNHWAAQELSVPSHLLFYLLQAGFSKSNLNHSKYTSKPNISALHQILTILYPLFKYYLLLCIPDTLLDMVAKHCEQRFFTQSLYLTIKSVNTYVSNGRCNREKEMIRRVRGIRDKGSSLIWWSKKASDEMTHAQRPEEGEGASHVDFWG